jgi:hypothetical protein
MGGAVGVPVGATAGAADRLSDKVFAITHTQVYSLILAEFARRRYAAMGKKAVIRGVFPAGGTDYPDIGV